MVLCSLIIINLFLNFAIMSKLIIITNGCEYLAISVFLVAERNDPNFFDYYLVGFFFNSWKRKKAQNDKVYFELSRSSVIHSTNTY